MEKLMKIYEYSTFEIKEIHLKLLKRSYWEYSDSCEGSTGMNIKRPYGNSDPLDDICEELGFERVETSHGDEVYLKTHFDIAKEIHQEMRVVLDIICKTLQVSTGVYRNIDLGELCFSSNWEKIE